MNTVINIKTDARMKLQAQKIAKDLGLNLSVVINAYLKQFVRTKTLFVSSKYKEPSEFLLSSLIEGEKELKDGKIRKFKNSKDAINFIDKIIKEG